MKDLTKGNIVRLLLAFSIPLLIGNVFQQLYNVVDTKVVGELLGEDALAAIGAGSPIFDLIISSLNGMGNGFGIVVSKYYGAKDMKKMRQAVASSVVLCAIICVAVTVLAMFLIRPMLLLIHTPEDIMPQCIAYIRFIILFMTVTAAYNLCASILRALGDTIRPLIFLAIATVINIGLDLLFVGSLHFGVQGAAYATVIAQAVSFLCCMVYIIIKCPELHLKRSDFVFEKALLTDLIGQGAAMAFMLCFVSVGTLILQSAINKFGTKIIAAHTIARKLSGIGMMPFSTLGVAAATFTGQNYGANKLHRIREGIRDAILLSWIWSVVVIVAVYLAAPMLIHLISGATTQEIVDTAQWYLRFDTPFYFVLGIVIVVRNALQGLGHKAVPMIASGIELLGKLAVAWLLADRMGYFGIIISEPVVWILMALLLGIAFLADARIKTQLAK